MTQLSANTSPGVFWLFFSPIGRVAREPYWLGFIIIWLVIGIAANMWLKTIEPGMEFEQLTLDNFMSSNSLFPILFFALQWVELALVIKRCQDRGITGFLALLVFLPIINIITVIVLGLLPSAPGPNKYGPHSNSYFRRKA